MNVLKAAKRFFGGIKKTATVTVQLSSPDIQFYDQATTASTLAAGATEVNRILLFYKHCLRVKFIAGQQASSLDAFDQVLQDADTLHTKLNKVCLVLETFVLDMQLIAHASAQQQSDDVAYLVKKARDSLQLNLKSDLKPCDFFSLRNGLDRLYRELETLSGLESKLPQSVLDNVALVHTWVDALGTEQKGDKEHDNEDDKEDDKDDDKGEEKRLVEPLSRLVESLEKERNESPTRKLILWLADSYSEKDLNTTAFARHLQRCSAEMAKFRAASQSFGNVTHENLDLLRGIRDDVNRRDWSGQR
jgi:hypothetical protein